MLAGKKILIAVTGSIAAYKTAFFVRLLVQEQAQVRVLMTDSAREFITPLTLATLSKNPVLTDFVKNKSGEWNNHVELGLWADLMIIAPASANTIGKMAHGQSDNLVLATYLSARCPVMIAPAMDLDMFQHPGTQKNLLQLESFGNIVLNPGHGELASGLIGQGRMVEPEELLAEIVDHFKPRKFEGKNVLITSGPTFEPIDAVRFIGNHSSGKMGSALANAFAREGAVIQFISGPSSHEPSHPNITISSVKTAREMFDAVENSHSKADICIFAAAVSDYRPKESSSEKRKRTGESFTLEMIENPDIAEEFGKQKSSRQFHVGFALETQNEEEHAKAKLVKKNFDLIVMNSLRNEGAGFGHDTNQITIYGPNNKKYPYELRSKDQVAKDILSLIFDQYDA